MSDTTIAKRLPGSRGTFWRGQHLPADHQEPTEQQMAMVEHLIANPGCTVQEAGVAAGYKDSEGGHRAARRALRLPWVTLYFQNRIREQALLKAPKALQSVESLMEHDRSGYVRLEAAKKILDMAEPKEEKNRAAENQPPVNISINIGAEEPPTVDVTPTDD